jgi:predicted nucleotidyltransferase component of viral defense system
MVTSYQIDKLVLEKLKLNVLPEVTKKAFLKCAQNSFFTEGNWYLAGGTALALQAGHRKSVDLDFFTSDKTFDVQKSEKTLSTIGTWETTSTSPNTLFGELDGAKISLIAYSSFHITKPLLKVGAVSVIDPADIATMKIIAVSQRGKKRDFFDLYWISLNIQSLFESIESAQKQYAVRHNPAHILKSLVYFEDAENDPEPVIFFNANWEEVKDFFKKEISTIAKKLMGLN